MIPPVRQGLVLLPNKANACVRSGSQVDEATSVFMAAATTTMGATGYTACMLISFRSTISGLDLTAAALDF